MKRKLLCKSLSTLVILTMAVAITGCGSSAAKEYTDKDRKISASTGEQFKIILDANETTGFAWQLVGGMDSKVVKKVSDEYQEPNTGAIGAGGKHYWTFEAVGPGKTTIKLKYVRPWEPDASPDKTYEATVTIS